MTWDRRRLAATAALAAAAAVVALAWVALRPVMPQPQPTWPVATERPTPPTARMLRLMPLGDSITYGVGSSDHAGYRIDLARRLAAAGISVRFVGSLQSGPPGGGDDNEGHSGWSIHELADHVTGWLAAARPDLILLHTGTNDMGTDRSAAAAQAQLGRLLDRITRARPAAAVFVAEIVGSAHPVRQARIDRYNAAVAALVAGRGGNLHLVDQRGVTAPLLRDGLHPDNAGYARMAAVWTAAIQRVLAPTGPSRTAA